MDVLTIAQHFPNHAAALAHLERVRWGGKPTCPHCQSPYVARKLDSGRIGRWNCHKCRSSFNALSGTIFQKTRVPLHKWFMAIVIIINAKKSVSSYQLARDLHLTQATAWYVNMRVRRAMVTEDAALLTGIVEADEAYLGPSPETRRRRRQDGTYIELKRGRGTDKLPILGAVERGGKVVAMPVKKPKAPAIMAFLMNNVSLGATLMTDEYVSYKPMGERMKHLTIDHSRAYVRGTIHTNTIEGFWGLLKRAWYGTHHHYSRKHAAAYIAEACFKYNIRAHPRPFDLLLDQAMGVG